MPGRMTRWGVGPRFAALSWLIAAPFVAANCLWRPAFLIGGVPRERTSFASVSTPKNPGIIGIPALTPEQGGITFREIVLLVGGFRNGQDHTRGHFAGRYAAEGL